MNLANLPPEKKRVLAIGLIAFIVLLFVSFLLSLLEDEPQTQTQQTQQQEQTQGDLQLNRPQVPNSQRFDFNQDEQQGAGLEQLLNKDQEIGVNNDPFANMSGQGTENSNASNDNFTSGAVEEELTMPQVEEPPQQTHTLYCDEFPDAQQAESQKAMLAFQGVSATVVQHNNTYRLKIGPFTSKDEAKQAFHDLGTKRMVKKCSLIAD